MQYNYQEGFPLVPIKIRNTKGEIELKAHIDFATSKTLVPAKVSEDLDLLFRGFASIATASGIVLMPLYEGAIFIVDKEFKLSLICYDLPKESFIRSLIGRDILDKFKVCLDGKKEEITFFDP